MAKKQVEISDNELDSILASVEATLSSTSLAKSAAAMPSNPNGGPMKKDDMPVDDEKPAEAAASAPEADAPADEPAAPPAQEGGEAEAPAEDAAPAADAAPAEEGLEQESAEQPLSDEELNQIYGSMSPEELQRHYMAIRSHLEQSLGGEQDAAPAQEAPAAPAQGLAMSEEEGKDEDERKEDKKEGMEKSESTEVKALKAKIEELEKGLSTAVKAVEMVLQPVRKSAAGIEFTKKNEVMEGKEQEDLTKLSKSDIDVRIKKIGFANFSKSERDSINAFLLDDAGKEKVLDIIKSKGGK